MAMKGAIIRVQSVNAEFDGAAPGTPLADTILIERLFPPMGLRRAIGDHLPAWAESSVFSTTDVVYALMAGLMVGGRGRWRRGCLARGWRRASGPYGQRRLPKRRCCEASPQPVTLKPSTNPRQRNLKPQPGRKPR